MAPFEANLPAIRACIFDMDGLLINTEDLITLSVNEVLDKYGRPPLTRSIRAQLMGVPNSTNGDIFHDWAKLPISREQFARESSANMGLHFPNCKPLPGARELLSSLSRACGTSSKKRIDMALASSTKSHTYELKTSRAEIKDLIGFFRPERRILGDDPRVPRGRGKPAPDIFLVALRAINLTKDPSEKDILPSECLVFEDSVAGVEAGRRAGMRVVWVPHPDMALEYESRQEAVFAGRTATTQVGDDCQLGEVNDGWIETIPTLEDFDYTKYGIT
ncbi:HAD superfamily hydrolase [Penicillium brevicompactum]|uniref:HAD superfamily hydrolase n=1 Tax=Penicillium brevicompactum TaxID=5074 RepID=UPI002540CE51|nr:HAD superfamily hydrolase [Penicillium brevicompactum]KAJ5337185.1 HAD superfamily hydrolase [Penicillium brevicompactum]